MSPTIADPRIGTIWTALGSVIDPELGLDIVTLGLVYGVEFGGSTARVTYTLTTPGCSMERAITDGVGGATLAVEGIDRVDTHIVWEPTWHPGMIASHAFPLVLGRMATERGVDDRAVTQRLGRRKPHIISDDPLKR
ncbi:MAG TPA: metal-sulfur cluster assembly factor [Gemmatimonadaceae bacterium]